MLLADLIRRVTRVLVSAHLPEPEAEILVAAALGQSRGELQLASLLGRTISAAQAKLVCRLADQRARREPLQHLLGAAPFYGRMLAVGPGVFVPRPETEVLVEQALCRLDEQPAGLVADIGSGTGAIAITVAAAQPRMRVVATEASPAAWPWLRRNLREHNAQVTARFGDWQAQLAAFPENFVALLSNPPYVPAAEIPRDPEVFRLDPAAALYSGADGLNEIRRISAFAAKRLRAGGFVLVEHSETQGEAVQALFLASGLVNPRTIHDLAGRPRHTLAYRAAA